MYSRNRDTKPTRPVVTTLLSALNEIEHWMEENQFRAILDGDGQMWDLDIEVVQVPNPKDPHGLLWQATVRLSAAVSTETFIDNGVLDRVKDERLVALVGDAEVPIRLAPSVYTAGSEEEMRQVIASVVPKLKAHFMKNSFYDIKRRLIGRFVDESCRFA